MSDFPISNLLIMIFILVVLFIKYNLILYQKRKEQLRELSYKLKFTYSEKGNDLLLSRIEKYELFHKNVSQNSTFVIDLCNVINGNYHGTDVTIFDVTALFVSQRFDYSGNHSGHLFRDDCTGIFRMAAWRCVASWEAADTPSPLLSRARSR